MSTPERVVNVDIQGQRYAVRCELDAHYITELAAYLDEKMRAAAHELTSADPLRVAVVAALNVADELFRARRETAGADSAVRLRTAEIERLLDAVLDEARVRVVNE
jgi:cell division protein ZapA